MNSLIVPRGTLFTYTEAREHLINNSLCNFLSGQLKQRLFRIIENDIERIVHFTTFNDTDSLVNRTYSAFDALLLTFV